MELNSRHGWRIAASAAVSVLLLGLLWHWVAGGGTQKQISFTAFWANLPLHLAGIYFCAALAQAAFRALRYRLLIEAHQPDNLPGWGHIYIVTLIRNMLVDFLPARLGELSYIAMMNRRYRVNGGACVASLTVSFVFDLIALLALVMGLLVFQQFHSGLVGRLPVAISALALVSVAALVCIYPLCRFVAPRLSRKLAGKSGARGWNRIGNLIALINEALQATARTGILLRTLGYSLAVRLIKYSGLYALFVAAATAFEQGGIIQGHGVGTVLTALLSAEGAASLPVPAFMGFGTYEAGGTAALTLLGISAAGALAIMLAIHILSQIIDYTLGTIAALIFLNTPGAANQQSRQGE